MANKIKLPLNEIKEKYTKGKTLTDIGNEYNVNRVTIKNRLVEMGVDLRKPPKRYKVKCTNCGKEMIKPQWEVNRSRNLYCSRKCAYNERYEYNENYFEVIDSPIKAYFLGFIMGDGNLFVNESKWQYALRIGINKRDRIIIDKFIGEIESNPKVIKQIKKHNQVWIAINNKKITFDLINKGIPFKDKSHTANPITLPEKYESNFWLGLFDADGSVSWNGSQRHRSLAMSLTGTKEICKGFSQFLGYNNTGISKSKGVYAFNLTISPSKGMIELYNKLYSDAPFFLPRKHNKFKEIIQRRKEYETS